MIFSRFQASLKLSLFTSLACIFAFFIHVLLSCFTEIEAILFNPILSGFLHRDPEHFALNMIILFFCLLHSSNQKYNFKQLFLVNLLVNAPYYFLVILKIMPFAIGLSGACNFFLSRALLQSNPIFKYLLAGIALYELIHVFEINRTAHIIHLSGLLLGGLSVYENRKQLWINRPEETIES